MYKLLETYYDHNIINILQKSNLTNKSQIKNIINQIINHFKLQIKCKNSYRVSAEIIIFVKYPNLYIIVYYSY